jgi:hypothetical protein
MKQIPSLSDEVHPLMSLRAEGEAISSFLARRLPRRPGGLLAMTDREVLSTINCHFERSEKSLVRYS